MEGIKALFQHPFFRGVVELEDNDYKKKMEAIKEEQEEMNRRLNNLFAALNGEDEWMLTLKRKGDCDG